MTYGLATVLLMFCGIMSTAHARSDRDQTDMIDMTYYKISCLYLVYFVTEAAATDFCDVSESSMELLIAGACRNQSTETEKRSKVPEILIPTAEDIYEWTPCSASCGEGLQRKGEEIKKCFSKFCPSYLSVPRIHFAGTFVADVSTVNNARCNYVNKRFSPAAMKEGLPYISAKGDGTTVESNNWNPDGSGRFRLHTKVTSLCTSSKNCSIDDEIVGREVKETTVVAMVDVDPDWQVASEIFGMTLKIEGVLEAQFLTSAIQSPKRRGRNVYAGLKSKLTDVTWFDDRLKRIFSDATSLSIMTTMDQFVEKTREGRIIGTIGLTSNDDPLSASAARRLLPRTVWKMKGSAPFYLHERSLTIDLSLVFNCTRDKGFFNVSALGDLDLAVYVTDDVTKRANAGSSAKLYYVTVHGGITKQLREGWYNTFGGVVDIDLSHLTDKVVKLMTSQRIVMLQKKATYRHARVIMAETEHGINMGFMKSHVTRLNPGETLHTAAYVSSYGRPLDGAKVSIDKIDSQADVDCGWDTCNRTLGVPSDALVTSHSYLKGGFARLRAFAAKDPGNVRGCELDGQIYPIALRLQYKDRIYVDGGYLRQSPTATSDHDYYLAVVPAVIAVYNEVHVPECPTWDDVKDTFMRYHNLYPVMWKYDVIDMSSYDDVKRRSRMLKYAMFEVDFDDPRFMPISRDLSESKTRLIRNWIGCGMKKEPEYPMCEQADSYLSELLVLLQRAVTLELTIIPPYFTAWLSLQTEHGRNKETANILKSVFVDEMLHMSLAANMLNAINGTVNLTTYSNLPHYPTSVGFGDGYKLMPNLALTLGKMSRGVVHDIFMPIEKPANKEQRKILDKVSQLLELLKPKNPSKTFLTEVHNANHESAEILPNHELVRNSTRPDWKEILRFAAQEIDELSLTKIDSIGAFYTMIALKLTFVESCLQQERLTTIFKGDVTYQMNMTHWHRPEDFSKVEQPDIETGIPVFEVTDLTSALQAIVAIIYEGEGGTSCTPFMDANTELPHYFRFMEIAHGRKLRKVFQPTTAELSACPNLGAHCHVTPNSNAGRFCFTGDIVPFHDDGVWPIVTNPDERMYQEGSEVKKWNKEFNLVYTNLLRCLERSFGGKPDHVTQCMQEMHNMKIVGKKVVQSLVMRNGHVIGHGTPTWEYQRDRHEGMGIPRTLPNNDLY